MISIDTSGKLFTSPNRRYRQAVNEALNKTSVYAKGLIQSRTPVRTGTLKAGWEVSKKPGFQLSVDNAVSYSPYVEARVGMAAKSQPEIEKYLSTQLPSEVVLALD